MTLSPRLACFFLPDTFPPIAIKFKEETLDTAKKSGFAGSQGT